MVNTGQNKTQMAECRGAAITGGLSGIGSGTVVALTQRAFDVVVCNRAIEPPAAETIQAGAALDARLAFVGGDIVDLGGHARLVDPTTGAAIQVDGRTHIHHYE